MNLDSLEKLADDDLRAVIARSEVLLKQHDSERKEKAMADARATLAAAGLSLRDLARKGPAKAKGPIYHAGRQYQHPTNKALLWNAKGQKPTWLRELEAGGGKAVELHADQHS